MKISLYLALLTTIFFFNMSECKLCKTLSDGIEHEVTEANYTCKRERFGKLSGVINCDNLPVESRIDCEPCYTWTDGTAVFHAPKSEFNC